MTRTEVGAIVLFLLGCGLAVPARTQAQLGQWSSMGPYGGRVASFAIDNSSSPSTLYAGTTDKGAFKSSDGGVSWGPFSDGLVSGDAVLSLAVDTATAPAATVYAGTGSGVFKSVGGSSWSAFSSGLQGLAVNSVAIDAKTATVYAGTSGGGVFKSVGGSPWSALNSGLLDLRVQSLAIDSTTTPSSTLYAATLGEGVFKSAGGSWSPFNDGLARYPNTRRLAVDATKTPLVLYVSSQLFQGGRIVDLVYRRTAADSSWSVVNSTQHLFDVASLAIDSATTPPTLYVGTRTGVFRSTDTKGLTDLWRAAGLGGVNGYSVGALAIDFATVPSPTIYAGTDLYGAFKSTDRGDSWNWAGINMPLRVNVLAVDPAAASTLYAGSDIGLFKSVDGGGSWSHLTEGRSSSIGFAHSTVTAVAIDTTSSPPTVHAATTGGWYTSADGGDTWGRGRDVGVVRSLAIKAGNPSTIFAGTDGGIYRSSDGAMSWSKCNTAPSNMRVHSLAIDKTPTRSTVYAATSEGIFKSQDDGDSWSQLKGLNGGRAPSLAIDAASSTLYAGAGAAVYKTTSDGDLSGTSWEPISSADFRNTWGDVTSLAVDDSRTPSVLYAGTYHGVYMHKSGAGEDDWSLVDSAGMTDAAIEWLVLRSGNPSTLYAGTPQGAFRRSWRDVSFWSGLQSWWKRWSQRVADGCWLPGAGSYWLQTRCP